MIYSEAVVSDSVQFDRLRSRQEDNKAARR